MVSQNRHFIPRAVYEKWTDPEKIRSFVFDAETNPIIREMLQSRRATLIPDTRKHAGWERPAGSDHVLSWIGAPLVAGGQVIGLYSIDRYELEPFTEKQVVLAEAMAGQAAVAIENARLYEQTQRHAEELEQRVAERTIELQERLAEVERLNATMVNLLEDLQATHRDLEATTSALRESKDEMEAFAYSVSHDLRAPLRAMKGLTIALLEDYTNRLDETGRDFARRIANASQQMDNLIQDLLAYSRVVRAELRPQPVSLYATVKEVLSQMEEKDGQIIVEGPLPEVAGHPAILTQVVSNLIYNAVKFVEPGVRPFVRVRAEDRGAFARLWVEDNGIGISPEYHERIFRVFERLHGAETYHGTGIGLAIVKKGVERMGGQVGIESALSEGSRFWVELPKAKSSGG
ncbi:MAG: ATP-binding protein [Blastocatellia bacterium]|nr:ATP-binding protein [Blastocatellia bacterium]